jgi:quercetin dioxygenase-like cupin family protein
MVFYSPDDRPAKTLAAGIVARTVWGEKMLMAYVDLAAHSVVPLHSHPHEQVGIVLQGELTLTVGGETKTLRAGDLYVIPGGVGHMVVTGAEDARALDIFSPVREEYKS